jgi:hypothetical protein
MKFDELIEMYLEEFNPSKETSRYTLGKKAYSTKGLTNLSKGKSDGFKGDTGTQEKKLIPAGLFPQKR